MSIKRQIIKTVILLLVLVTVLIVTDPRNVPVVVYILPFTLIFLTILNSCRLVELLWNRTASRPLPDLTTRNRRTSLAISLFITFIIVLQSLGQLAARDMATLVPLFVIGYFYLARLLSAR